MSAGPVPTTVATIAVPLGGLLADGGLPDERRVFWRFELRMCGVAIERRFGGTS